MRIHIVLLLAMTILVFIGINCSSKFEQDEKNL